MGKFVIKTTKSGVKFDLKAGNGEVIATSEVYSTMDACKNGVASVQKNAPIAAIEDQTVKDFETQKNPKFEICATKGGEWIRVSGEAVLDERIEAQQHMLDENPGLQRMYKAGDGNTAVYWIKNGVAVISSYTADPVTIEF